MTAAGQYTAGGTITGTTLSIRKHVVAPGAPTAAPGPGEYHIAQSIRLNGPDQTATATIHHTADGTTPNALSPEDNPVSVTATQT
jgi:chitobiase/beta-hexosaminidase-like protein